GKLAERDKPRAWDRADLRFDRLAHVEYQRRGAGVDSRFQLAGGHFQKGGPVPFFRRAENCALMERRNGWTYAANRTVGVFRQLDVAEAHAQRVVEKQTSHERLADSENEFDRFRRLNRADDPWQHAEH